MAEAADLKELGLSGAAGGISSVVTLGMGGSGIGGDVVKAIVEDDLAVPFIVCKGYKLPAFVDPGTLVIAISYSGETEETLTAFEAAEAAGASILVITSGGRIAARASEADYPVVAVPAGLQPRAALGYLALSALVALRRIGLVANESGDIDETLALLVKLSSDFGPAMPTSDNPAKRLAGTLLSKLPVIYGTEGISAIAALRWKCQINENAKTPSFWHAFPELNHNEIVGWQELASVTKEFGLVVLRDSGEYGRVSARIGITVPLISEAFANVAEVTSEGITPLARLMSLIYLGDFASVYLAILNGVDPTPVERIQELKSKLSEID